MVAWTEMPLPSTALAEEEKVDWLAVETPEAPY